MQEQKENLTEKVSQNPDEQDINSTENIVSEAFSNADDKQDKPKVIEISAGSTLFGYFLGAMIIFGVCFILNLFLFQIIFTPIKVVGESMRPTINASAKGVNFDLYTDTVYYTRTNNYKCLDIVVINGGKTESGNKIIKRIVAMPGQTIKFKKAGDAGTYIIVEYYVDGVLMNDDYTLETQMEISKAHSSNNLYEFHNTLIDALQNNVSIDGKVAHEYSYTLGEDEYFVMGDNRNNSVDSRMFGAVKQSEICGKVVIHVKYGKTFIQSLWQAIFSNRLLFGNAVIKI